METQAQFMLLWAGTSPRSHRVLLLLSGGVSQQRMKYILFFCWRLLPGSGVY